jgi:asparagine synthase (glutamine-hydrolysing)
MPRAFRWGTLLENIGRDPAAAYFADLCVVKPDVARRLLGLAPSRDLSDSSIYDVVTEAYRRCPSSNPLQRAQYADVQIYLANDVLVKVDRMTMQHSVEVRAPLLDRRVVELAFRIPAERKMPRLRSKYLLRQLARKRLPREIATLPKHGFSAPMSEWLAGPCANRFREDVFSSAAPIRDLVDTTLVRRLFKEHRRGHSDHGQVLWSVWMLARWAETAVSRSMPSARRNPAVIGLSA